MNKIKTVSLILVASMCLSLTGCSGKKKAIVEAADSYAQALLSRDTDDIADLMADDDEFEEAIESYLYRYTRNEDLEDVFDFILENTTYEIDKKSIAVTDKKAIVNITFTMVDYMNVYEDLDDDADAEDYLDELEDNTDNTMTIRQKIEFKLVKDEWKIVDDDFDNVFEVYEFYQEISDLGFGTLKPYTCDEIEDILIDVLDADRDDISSHNYSSYEALSYFDNGISIRVIVYDDNEEASEEFEEEYDGVIDMVIDDFDGNCSYDFDGETGYSLIDGTAHASYSGQYYYGGVYLAENTIITVISVSDSSSSKDDVDALLNALGYPTP